MRAGWVAGALLLAGCSGTQIGDLSKIPVGSLGRLVQQGLPISHAKELEIGFGIASVVAGRYRLADDPQLQRYVGLVGHTVAVHSPRAHEVEFRFGVLAADDVNAFAAPGGWIFVTRGALALMEDEAELAGVLAHEVAHVDQKHVLEQVRRSAVLATARDESQITGPLLDEVAAAGSGVLFSGLSRRDELEADSLGVLYAAAAGYRADGLQRFLTRLHGAQDGAQSAAVQQRLSEWRASHPPASDRIDALQRQLAAGGTGATGADRFRRFVRKP